MAFLSKILAALLLTPIALLAVMLFRAEVLFPRSGVDGACNSTHKPIAGDEIVHRFSKALTFQTITRGLRNYDGQPRLEFARFLAQSKLTFKFSAVNHFSPQQAFPPFTHHRLLP